MQSSNPFDSGQFAPRSAAGLAERCESHSWDDDTDDTSRILLEHAADALREMMSRCVRLACVIESLEARAVQ